MRDSYVLNVRRTLVQSMSFEPTPRKPKKPERRQPSPHSDELVALVRGDRELRKMKLKDIAVKRGLPVSTVSALVNYLNRPHINPI